MKFFERFLANHVLANLTFGLAIALGIVAYQQMPRAKDPELNFNWVNVVTLFPGAAAIDVEKRVTDPLEDALRRSVKDIKFVNSTSRDGISMVLVRFQQIEPDVFDKHMIDLRREVQNTEVDEFPEGAEVLMVFELSTSNAFPSAMVVVTSAGDDENLRRQTQVVKKDLERIKGVDRVDDTGMTDPELQVAFFPERLEGLGLTPADLADTLRTYFQDVSAGDLETGDGKWVVRLQGASADLAALKDVPIVTAAGVVPLGSVAQLVRTREEPGEMVRHNGKPAMLLSITKTADANVLELVDTLNEYLDARNRFKDTTGVELTLADDQTVSTREAISIMQSNALVGLFLVLLVTLLFLGTRIALLTTIGIPFTLCGTFLVLNATGFTLNNSVLLGVVIVLGMIVDDAVVVVEAIYYRLQRGAQAMAAVVASFREVFAPVTSSVLTTIAAFLPLVLLPGILGEFMKVIPLVVTIALLISLLEAYWILPAHVLASKVNFSKAGPVGRKREALNYSLRLRYTRALVTSLRHPFITVACIILAVTLAAGALASGLIRFNFFEFDSERLFYLNVEMPQGTTLQQTDHALLGLEQQARKEFLPGELRAAVSVAGYQLTETEPLFGDARGQILFSLHPQGAAGRKVSVIADAVLQRVQGLPGPVDMSVLELQGGPPASRAVIAKILGSDYPTMLRATNDLRDFLEQQGVYKNITTDYRPGNPELVLRLDGEAIQRAGLNPGVIGPALRAYVDGEIVTDFQDQGEEVKVRLLAKQDSHINIDNLMRQTLSLPDGRSVALDELLVVDSEIGRQNIRHYNFRRAITIEADIDRDQINTIEANNLITEKWRTLQGRYPQITLDQTGELDDIQESLDSIWLLMLLGMGIIYIILGTQFRSYFQPFMVLATVPLTFTGVALGLLVTGNPLSLFTIYGVVALVGISVNAAIVLISAANMRLAGGMSLLHATVYAARRRVIPIIITSMTTIAGLLSLAIGLAGESVVWGPVATAIVWGLMFSTLLTLFVIPLLYRTFMAFSARAAQ